MKIFLHKIIINMMIKNNHKNNPKDFDFFEHRLYNKIEIDTNNVTDSFQKSPFGKA